jgi:cytochrome c oxidase subunit 2
MRRQVARDPGDTVRAGSPSPSQPSSFAPRSCSRKLRETEGTVRKRLLWATAAIGLLLLMSACAPNATQDTLQPKGPYAQELKSLFVPVFWVAVAVFVIVEGAIVWISIRYRHRKGRDRMPAQIHGNTRLEIGWTIAPALILAGVMVPTIATIWDLARKPPADALHVTVEGFQWWWGFKYTDPDMQSDFGDGAPIRTSDVLVIPAGRVVYLSLESAGGLIKNSDPERSDYTVIHSFWIPELAGKQDVVPGRTNHILMQADHPGTYTGQCAEFCGLQHGRMLVRVRALSAEDWDAWVANQKRPGVTPAKGSLASRGMDLFLSPLSGGRGTCVACHAVGGTEAGSPAAPELTHFADPTHECFAGCNWETTDREALEAWLHDPNGVKLGAKMANYHLSPEEIDALVAYLYSLK